jgi:hypothetical protein
MLAGKGSIAWLKEIGALMPQTCLDQTTLQTTIRGSGRGRWLRRGLILAAAAAMAAWAAAAGGVAAAAPTAPAAHRAGAPRAGAPGGGPVRPAAPLPGQPDFGPNVYVFSPSMPQSQIQATVDAIASQQIPNQFGTQRYALLFEPGTYGSAADPLVFQVGYYTEVAGLGTSPGDVTINGSIDVYNQCFAADNCIALDNFWRSLSNLTINVTGDGGVPGNGCYASTEFWAVSQAAPMRRVQVNGLTTLMDYCTGSPDFASGGFIADSAFTGSTVINGSQQQFLVRNSNLDGWTNGVWNQVFSGDTGAPAQSFGVPGSQPYTTLATSPVTEEEPYLQTGATGNYSVFVPAVQHNSSGTTWSAGATPGTAISISRFFIASPSTPVGAINAALGTGKDLILTPGVYSLASPIEVTRPDTIVLGLGFPTLVPQHGTAAMQVNGGASGAKLSGMIFDAGPRNSPALLRLDPSGSPGAGDPTLVQDVFFRIGGATPGQATDSLVVDRPNVILDDIWAWRADHGAGVGWTANTADTGVVINGDDVTAYGLFAEHYQKYQVIWNGQGGTDIFFQNEMPYDPPSQAAWMASPAQDGYPAFLVTHRVTSFQGYGMGSYSFFELGIPIEASTAFQVPDTPGIQMHDLLTVFLNGSGGIQHVVNDTGAAVNSANHGPSDVVSYP